MIVNMDGKMVFGVGQVLRLSLVAILVCFRLFISFQGISWQQIETVWTQAVSVKHHHESRWAKLDFVCLFSIVWIPL